MNVRTSTMVTGIRGTCGVIESVSSKASKLYLIEGKVTLGTGKNANVTLQSREYLTIPSGKTLIVQSKISGDESTGYTYGFKMMKLI